MSGYTSLHSCTYDMWHFVEGRPPRQLSSRLRYEIEAPEVINNDADGMLLSEMTSLATNAAPCINESNCDLSVSFASGKQTKYVECQR